MSIETEQIDCLADDVARLEALLVKANDAFFAVAGVLARVIVDANVTERSRLADAIEERARPISDDDHNELLLAFSRAVRMNFAGGRFDVIDGGRAGSVDPVAS